MEDSLLNTAAVCYSEAEIAIPLGEEKLATAGRGKRRRSWRVRLRERQLEGRSEREEPAAHWPGLALPNVPYLQDWAQTQLSQQDHFLWQNLCSSMNRCA
ncbi:15 kDa selenoprotein [Platysternon megacephalum]|uniref:15 kDa selenoprotein n=1 Tax=Platysternon megacephalum TaxID=55544 RepID=A0A4D9E638_9SAUR|nr:15 kDa selenoprotein [Platysternon megacephalum]